MDRLVAFGCSHTFGQALPDCDFDYGMVPPSKLSWPFKLGEMLKIDVHNAAIPGASNKQIMNQILTFPFKNTDTAIVLWSYADRFTILDQDRNKYYNYEDINYRNQLVPNMTKNNRTAKYYYRYVYNRTDNLIMTAHYISYVKLYLNSQNIINYHTCAEEIHHPSIFSIKHGEIRNRFPKASDGMHVGEKGHMETARRIYKRMTS